jgi:SAM-dependent methyltransferase
MHGKVLNVGAGGDLGNSVGDALSIDIDPARRPDIVADVSNLDGLFADNTFDAVFMLEVLEHVKNPRKAMSEVLRILKPGGVLVLSTPFIFEIHDAPCDFWRFTRFGISELLKDFELVQIEQRNGYCKAMYTPLIRLMYSKYILDRFVGVVFTVLSVPLYPVIMILDLIIRSDYAVTGYHVKAIKPNTAAS